MLDENELSALLRLKRHEQPPPEYFEKFLHEFHRRQREEMLRQPVWRIVLDRVSAFFSEQTAPQPKYAFAFVAAVLIAGVTVFEMTAPRPVEPLVAGREIPGKALPAGRTLALDEPGNAAVFSDQPFNDRARVRGSSQPRYVIDARPATYDPAASY